MPQCPTCQIPVEGDALFCPRDGTPLGTRSGDPLVGKVIGGRYRLVERLGQGGMGTVYRALHTLMDKPVAVKVLRGALTGDADAALRFHREARSASRLDHEHCIRVTDFGQSDDGLLYLVMELLDGEGLGQAISRGPLAPGRAATVALAVARALGHAHEHGVVHRDLKPDNIFLARRRGRDVVKVLDFGLAKLAGDGTTGNSITRAGVVFGTPEYMAPEQAQGLVLDARSDLYSLGVILYHMLTGQLPFQAPTFLALLAKQVQEPPVPPRERRPDLEIPKGLEQVVLRLMEKEPSARYASAEEVAAALEPWAEAPATTGLISTRGQAALEGEATASTADIGAEAGGGAGRAARSSAPRSAQVAAKASRPPSGGGQRVSSSSRPASGAGQRVSSSSVASGRGASGGFDAAEAGFFAETSAVAVEEGSRPLPAGHWDDTDEQAAIEGRGDGAAVAPDESPSLDEAVVLRPRRLGLVVGLVLGAAVLAGGSVVAIRYLRRPVVARPVEQAPVEPLTRARELLAHDDLDGAAGILEAQRRAGDGVELQLLLGELAERRGNSLRAMGNYVHASRLAPERAEPHARLASLAALLGQRQDACREARLALARDPKNAMARAAAANAGCKEHP